MQDSKGNEIGIYTGKSPRQAALKAANKGYTEIKLRERGTKKIHAFVGERVQVDKPGEAPEWLSEKIWKPNVRKVGRSRSALGPGLWSVIRRITSLIRKILSPR